MSNQTKGTTTNMSKLVAWDIDEYLGYSDEGCLICLTQQELYLLRNPLRQMEWSTRWTSELGTAQPDRSSIAERLAYKLSGTNCIDFCQMMIDCLNDPESGVAEAFAAVLGSEPASLQRGSSQLQNGTSLMGVSNPTCDLDILFGQCLQLVEYMDTQHEDLFEIIEVVSNSSELISQVFGGGSGRTAATIDLMLTWLTFVQNSIAENYSAQITQTYKEELACEWFCLARDNNCVLTPDILFSTMQARLNSQITIQSFIEETLDFLISGAWSGQEIADFMFFAQFAIRAQVGVWIGEVAWYDIKFRMAVFANDPNSDWTLLCTNCQWVWESTFEDDQNIWSPFNNVGEDEAIWTEGVGYTSADAQNAADTWSRLIFIETSTFTGLAEITQVQFEYSLTKGSYSSDAPALHISLGRNSGGREVQQSAASVSPAGDNLFYTFNLNNDDYEDIWLYVRSSASNGVETYSGSCELHSVRVTGIGFNPFE